jgi:integrase
VSPAAGGAAARALPREAGRGREFSHVLAGVMLDGDAALLAAALAPAFLAEAGWDPVRRMLSLPAGHRLLGRAACKVSGCQAAAYHRRAGVCHRCFTRLTGLGMTAGQIGQAGQLPPVPGRTGHCAVPGCRREPASAEAALCWPHKKQRQRRRSPPLEEFLAGPGVRPLGPVPDCAVPACPRISRASGYCAAHYRRWREALKADPGLDAQQWRQAQQPAGVGGVVSLHGLPPLVAVEVLSGLWQRTREGAKTEPTDLRMACRALARQQVTSVADCDAGRVRGSTVPHLLRALSRHVRLALADPEAEQAQDIWDLGVFGHRGRIDFTGITQRWLRESAKRWAAQDLPRHRGRGAANVRAVINTVARLSESLRARPDHGDVPAALGRRDIENLLNRLGYLESAGTISRWQRNQDCRGVRTVLAGVRALGLARPGAPAAGLPGDVTITAADIPALPEPGEPGRDLPAEIIDALCAGLGALQPEEIKTAVQIAIDTGRRPEEITCLRLDCLTRDRDGKPVLVYDNLKACRDRRRLPVSEDTAAVITAQQARVTARFPATPPAELPLLPTGKRNPAGRRHISIAWLEERHRDWVASLGPLTTRDGTPFDPAKIVLYAYRHTYAQRHADAGVPIDVLAKLLDHKNLDKIRGYYRVGEDRRRAAVDKVTAMSFDRHGNRTWRQARALMDAEHARYAIGQVAVPYGTCTEPSNVAAGGTACPVRFRCAGCDHFRTDVSYLPDLTAYLDDLLRTRERLAAAIDGVDDWARADAMPAEEEITRIRRLIGLIKGDMAPLSDAERAQVQDAVTVIRKNRAVSLGMPSVRAFPPAPAHQATA